MLSDCPTLPDPEPACCPVCAADRPAVLLACPECHHRPRPAWRRPLPLALAFVAALGLGGAFALLSAAAPAPKAPAASAAAPALPLSVPLSHP